MGYDLYIKRKLLIKKDMVNLDSLLLGNSSSIVISEELINLSGWDISSLVSEYVEMDTQEIDIEDLISLYTKICISRNQETRDPVMMILLRDLEESNTEVTETSIFYELDQSY